MALLEIRNLTKHFFRLSALSGVSLSVEPGELLGVIGPNGSGKTTLFNCVTGVLAPSGGHVLFRGEDITGRSPDIVYQRGVARTFQLIQLFPEMTVLENMLVAAQERTGTLLSRLLCSSSWASRGSRTTWPRTSPTASKSSSTSGWRSCPILSSSCSTSRWPA